MFDNLKKAFSNVSTGFSEKDLNEKDIEDVPEHVSKDMTFHFAKEIWDVLKIQETIFLRIKGPCGRLPP